MSELKIQNEVYVWFYNTYPQYRIKSVKLKTPRCLLIHNFLNPRSAIEGAKLSGCGLTRGLPDMTLFIQKGGYGALFMELKIEGEKPRIEQTEMIEALKKAGYYVTCCDTVEKAKTEIINYLGL